jgi:hypothetical protein
VFGTQAIRLLREYWPNAKMLAQELYAMFLDTTDLTHAGTLTMTPKPGVSPFTVQYPDAQSSGPVFNYTYGDGTEGGGFSVGDTGGVVIQGSSVEMRYTDPETGQQQSYRFPESADRANPSNSRKQQQRSGGGGFPAQVVSGSANDYQVAIYPNGTAKASSQVAARQLYIHPSESLAAGDWVTVISVDDGDGNTLYYMQEPVWRA